MSAPSTPCTPPRAPRAPAKRSVSDYYVVANDEDREPRRVVRRRVDFESAVEGGASNVFVVHVAGDDASVEPISLIASAMERLNGLATPDRAELQDALDEVLASASPWPSNTATPTPADTTPGYSTPVLPSRAVPLLRSPPRVRRVTQSQDVAERLEMNGMLDLFASRLNFGNAEFEAVAGRVVSNLPDGDEMAVRIAHARDNLLYEFRHEPEILARISSALRVAGFLLE